MLRPSCQRYDRLSSPAVACSPRSETEAVSLESSSEFELVVLGQLDSAMAEQFPNNSSTGSGSSPGSSAGDQTSTGCVVHPKSGETAMWEEWTQATSTVGDEVSTSNFLPDLTTSSTSSFQTSDMLSTWMSTFHPLSHPGSLISPDPVDDPQPAFLHDGLAHLDSDKVLHDEMVGDATDALPLVYDSKTTGVSRQLLRALGPLSPSSPLAIHNGLLNPLGDPWDGCPSTCLQWSKVTTTGHSQISDRSSFFPDHSATAIDHLEEDITTSPTRSFASKPRHTDIFIGPNGTFESATPGGWTPQSLFDHHGSSEMKALGLTSVTPMKLMASLREVGEATSCGLYAESKLDGSQEIAGLVSLREPNRSAPGTSPAVGSSMVTMTGMHDPESYKRGAESTLITQVVRPGKHRLELVELMDDEADVKRSAPVLKRPKIPSGEEAKALQWSDQTLRGAELRYCPASGGGSLASQAMDIIAIGPALNTNGKPRARRGSATDPQSVYARHRREKINERLKSLQNLVPNGAKVDIVTMLDEAIHYVKFLQNQIELLKSDDYWMYATPNTYNGMDLSELCTHSQELESSA